MAKPSIPETNYTLLRLAPLAIFLLMTANAVAQQPISLNLSGNAEVPPVVTSASGTGQVTIFADHTVSGSIKVSGLIATMAHIHEAAIGMNGPPIISLVKTADDSFAVPPGAKLNDAQFASYLAGNLYINVHSEQYKDGAIRTQLIPPGIPATATRPAY